MRPSFRALFCVCAIFFALRLPAHASPLTVYYTEYDKTGTSFLGEFTVNGTKLFDDLSNPGRYTLNVSSFVNLYDGTDFSTGGAGTGSTLKLFSNGSFNLTLLTDPVSFFVPRKNNANGDALTCFTVGCSFHEKVDGVKEFFNFTPQPSVAQTPEPSSWILMGTGVLMLLTLGSRYRISAPGATRTAQRL